MSSKKIHHFDLVDLLINSIRQKRRNKTKEKVIQNVLEKDRSF
jgi:hypothetical protein